MGWGKDCRNIVWERQMYVCPLCQRYLPKSAMVLHHIKNRHHGGQYTVENAEGRHANCESLAHELDHHGNPDILYFLEVYNGGSREQRLGNLSAEARADRTADRRQRPERVLHPSSKKRKARQVRVRRQGGKRRHR